MENPIHLPLPAHYFPFMEGQYRVSAGLYKIQTDFGNSTVDQQCTQLDQNYLQYRDQKISARSEDLGKYIQLYKFNDVTQNEMTATLTNVLTREHPQIFNIKKEQKGNFQFINNISGDILDFTPDGVLTGCVSDLQPTYLNSLDALACQLQEDIAIVSLDDSGHEYVSALHLCFPNYWSAQDKIGRSFISVHKPVPNFERVEKNHVRMLQTLIHQGPFVRFAWGITTDTRLNHHPVPPEHTNADQWHGRSFNPAKPELYVRVERQVTLPLPHSKSFLFLIRTYFEDVSLFRHDHKKVDALMNAIHDMKPDTLTYKGIAEQKNEILAWLKTTVEE